jgi:hypothetical protein
MPGATFKLAKAYTAPAVVVADGAMTAGGSNPRILSSATANFSRVMIGRPIIVEGAGAAGADLETVVEKYISATKVELRDPALTTVAGSDLTYDLGVYRLSEVLAQPDVAGNSYQIAYAHRLQLQINQNSPGGKLCIGGPYVTPENCGIELTAPGQSDNYTPGRGAQAVMTSDYLTSDTADQLINIYWLDDLNLSTPA